MQTIPNPFLGAGAYTANDNTLHLKSGLAM